jgi:hypothetical protein
LAFPLSGANYDVFVYHPQTDQVFVQSMFSLPDSLREMLSSSNMQFAHKDSMLYIVGGYGWSDAAAGFITFPNLVKVNMNHLINTVENGGSIDTLFHSIHDQRMAVCGGEMELMNLGGSKI